MNFSKENDMKKILMMLLCTLLAAALISTLIACDNGNTPDTNNGGNTNNGGTDKVWFYQMRADGLSLDPHRVPVDENDIPDIVARFNNLQGEESRERTEQSFFVPKAEIVEKNYAFSFGRYADVAQEEEDGEPFEEKMARLTGELSGLFAESHKLEAEIRQKLEAIGYGI
jgi:type I restriction-modification system DNA methylase subunit